MGKTIFSCPAAKVNTTGFGQATYGLNSYMFAPDSAFAESFNLKWQYRVLAVEKPSRTILIGDMKPVNCDFISTSDNKVWFGSVDYCPPDFRHAGEKRANMLFCDGHVEALDQDQLLLQPPSGESLWKWW